ncbi:MAG: GNAT family N-acetyltransferase [Myxococcales bacterium]|jgi:ribosomal protein S18 acetylase RimI-like enzyme
MRLFVEDYEPARLPATLPATMEIRPFRMEDRDAVADVIARAFRDNPAMIGVIGADGDTRERALRAFAGALIPVYLKHGEVWVAREASAVRAATLSLPPGRYPLPPLADLRLFWAALRHGGPGVAMRFARSDAVLRQHHLQTPHHYLFMIGTDPQWQGRGLGSALLKRLTADAADAPCYLETDKRTSVQLYERHGFQTGAEADLLDGQGAFHVWFMRRAA